MNQTQLVLSDAEWRDFFAGMAMQGLLATNDYGTDDDLAQSSYSIADTMMKARKANQK